MTVLTDPSTRPGVSSRTRARASPQVRVGASALPGRPCPSPGASPRLQRAESTVAGRSDRNQPADLLCGPGQMTRTDTGHPCVHSREGYWPARIGSAATAAAAAHTAAVMPTATSHCGRHEVSGPEAVGWSGANKGVRHQPREWLRDHICSGRSTQSREAPQACCECPGIPLALHGAAGDGAGKTSSANREAVLRRKRQIDETTTPTNR